MTRDSFVRSSEHMDGRSTTTSRTELGLALLHQFDVFPTVQDAMPLNDIGGLDDLATELFGFDIPPA